MSKIGVGITTRNRPELLAQCVENMKKHSCFDSLIVVDDASDVPVKIKGTRVFRFDKQQGISRAKNKCLELLDECDYIFLFDDDCWPIRSGWEKLYINASKLTGNNHFCFTWEDVYFRVDERFTKQKVKLSIQGIDDIILDGFMHDTHVRIRKVRAGLHANTPYTQVLCEEESYDIKSHENPTGAMLFVTKKVLQKVGGFNIDYKIYGGDHIGYTHRIFNAGLNPFGKFLDVNTSESYFYAQDRDVKLENRIFSIPRHITEIYGKHNEKILEIEKQSSDFHQYKETEYRVKSDHVYETPPQIKSEIKVEIKDDQAANISEITKAPIKNSNETSKNQLSIPLIDRLFSHANIDKNKHFTWDRDVSNYDYAIITDQDIEKIDDYKNKTLYGWIIESPEISIIPHEYVRKNSNRFKTIFTHSRELLELSPIFRFVPASRCWISPDKQKIWKKKKIVSIICSNKNTTSGHKLRHSVINHFKEKMHVYGRGWKEIEDKIDGLKDYMFSVAIENSKKDYYFTEKLMDCFMTGTVPIYYGCPSISKFFDERGILVFDNEQQLENILKDLTPEKYSSMLPYIKNNFELCKEYLTAEDYMFKNYKHIVLNEEMSSTPIDDYFDKIFCVNLDRRKDKWEECVQEFKKHNLRVERISAVDGNLLKISSNNISPAEMGCSLSHSNILKRMIKENWSRILILEDDVEFIPNVQEYFGKNIINIPIGWEFLYFGGNHIEPPTKINPVMSRITRTYTTSHYAITNKMARKIVDDIERFNSQVDVTYTKFQPITESFSFSPSIAWQRAGFSDITNAHADYTSAMKPKDIK